jgi:DNA-binding transcriptional regulator YdaS (Cro superfamily)
MDKGLHRAVEQAGSLRKLAKKIGVSHQAISQWRSVPAHRLLAVERATGIPRAELRPDLALLFERS